MVAQAKLFFATTKYDTLDQHIEDFFGSGLSTHRFEESRAAAVASLEQSQSLLCEVIVNLSSDGKCKAQVWRPSATQDQPFEVRENAPARSESGDDMSTAEDWENELDPLSRHRFLPAEE